MAVRYVSVRSFAKQPPFRSKRLRESARGAKCTLQIPDCCNHDSTTVVLAHVAVEGGTMGGRGSDIGACFACHECHSEIDGRRSPRTLDAFQLVVFTRRAMVRTVEAWVEMGILEVTR